MSIYILHICLYIIDVRMIEKSIIEEREKKEYANTKSSVADPIVSNYSFHRLTISFFINLLSLFSLLNVITRSTCAYILHINSLDMARDCSLHICKHAMLIIYLSCLRKSQDIYSIDVLSIDNFFFLVYKSVNRHSESFYV